MSPLEITLVILLVTIIAFVSGKVPFSVISTGIILALILTGIKTPAEAFGGFINTNVVMFVAMFVIGAGLTKTPLIDKAQSLVIRYKDNMRMLIFLSCVAGAFLGAITSATATAAIMIPLLVGIANDIGVSRSKLLYPSMACANILYNVIQRLINGSTSQFSIDGNAKLLIGLDSADATLSEHQGTLAKDQIRLRGKDGLLGNRLLIAKAVQRSNFIGDVAFQSIVIIEHADNFILEPQLDEQLSHGQLCGQHLLRCMVVGHIYSIPIGIIDLQGQRVGSLLSGRNGALGHR